MCVSNPDCLPVASIPDTQPQLDPALLRLSAIISQYFHAVTEAFSLLDRFSRVLPKCRRGGGSFRPSSFSRLVRRPFAPQHQTHRIVANRCYRGLYAAIRMFLLRVLLCIFRFSPATLRGSDLSIASARLANVLIGKAGIQLSILS